MNQTSKEFYERKKLCESMHAEYLQKWDIIEMEMFDLEVIGNQIRAKTEGKMDVDMDLNFRTAVLALLQLEADQGKKVLAKQEDLLELGNAILHDERILSSMN